jgi:hypothetical protein
MDNLTVFGMPLSEFLLLTLKLSIGYGVIMAAFIMWGERHWKGMADELDELAGPVEELEPQGFWAAFRQSLATACRRDVWVPLAVIRAWFRRRKD